MCTYIRTRHTLAHSDIICMLISYMIAILMHYNMFRNTKHSTIELLTWSAFTDSFSPSRNRISLCHILKVYECKLLCTCYSTLLHVCIHMHTYTYQCTYVTGFWKTNIQYISTQELKSIFYRYMIVIATPACTIPYSYICDMKSLLWDTF